MTRKEILKEVMKSEVCISEAYSLLGFANEKLRTIAKTDGWEGIGVQVGRLENARTIILKAYSDIGEIKERDEAACVASSILGYKG